METMTSESYAALKAGDVVQALKAGDLSPAQVRELEANRGGDPRVTVLRQVEAIEADPTHPSTYAGLTIADVVERLDAGDLTVDQVQALEDAREGGARAGVTEELGRRGITDAPPPSDEETDRRLEQAARDRGANLTRVDAEPTERPRPPRPPLAPPPETVTVSTSTGVEQRRGFQAPTIDPRLVEDRDALRAAEDKADRLTSAAPDVPTIDPRLVEVRDAVRAREEELERDGATLRSAPDRLRGRPRES